LGHAVAPACQHPASALGRPHFIKSGRTWPYVHGDHALMPFLCFGPPPLQRHENQPPNPKSVTIGLIPQPGNLSTGWHHYDGSPQPLARGGKKHRAYPNTLQVLGWGTKDTYLSPRSAARIRSYGAAQCHARCRSFWRQNGTLSQHVCAAAVNHITLIHHKHKVKCQIQRRKSG
jgi:hypothetical protein